MTRIFLLTVSNQYNAYNLILRLKKFMYTKHNGDNAKLRIFSFIPQRQRIQPNFMNHTYQTTKHTNTTRTTKTTTSTLVSPLTQSLCSYNRGNANLGVFIFKLHNKLSNFVHFIHHQFKQFINPEKPVRSLMNNFVHFIHPYMNPLPKRLLLFYSDTLSEYIY